ncbi:putative NBD/HSP70 family sugar kinase [Agromyces flavus]|uniref:NBD/HSP70 family sugar kinase n=1 Tax=Agromyces flavus TaxID=589382 RepID=A0A1H1P0N9_9MICO|nr:ROK family protein [Agromyces flavus]MCP2368013.1 putative NBD/HSP70 family sugar kinase [Agromyces flavus]GGI47474.1 sugar kinase [Agromyces flavus]SDS04600.1 Sugar kinase of the NBD/HSP70 family, may contain an N-terminal HTH domain [Agromyces flavus]
MTRESTLRFGAQTDEVTSLLRIVNMVRTGEATTRPEIGRLTGLGRGVVTQRVDQAIEMGFLADGEFAPSSGGRAPRTLRFCSEQGRIIVCAFGALHLRVGIASLDGDVIDDRHAAWDIARGPAETIDRALEMLDEILSAHDDIPVWGVAVGIPGPVDFDSGRPVAPPIMPGWNDFDLRRRFEERFDAPVWVDNDTNLLAFSERSRRPDERLDLIFFKVGTGIGAGLLSHGRIHRGANGAAGDVGHVRVRDSDTPCRCGKVGCLEAEAGGWALVRDAQRAIEGGATGALARHAEQGTAITPELIALAAMNGDALAISLIQRSARLVGESIAALVNMFNPAVIVVGGAVSSAGEVFLAEVRQRVYELSLPLATRDLSIVRSLGDEKEPLRGGAEMVREQLFEATFPRWFAAGRPLIREVMPVAS